MYYASILTADVRHVKPADRLRFPDAYDLTVESSWGSNHSTEQV